MLLSHGLLQVPIQQKAPYIFTPNQPEHLRPFLIKKDIDPTTNRRRKEILFGLVERVSHSSDPTSIEALHGQLRVGREASWRRESIQGLIHLESRRVEAQEQFERKKNLESLLTTRAQTAIESVGLKGKPCYSLVTAPIEITEVQTLLSSGPDSIARLLENPPSLRYAGWGMETETLSSLGGTPAGQSQEYELLDLYRDGTFVFACTADHSLLGWGNTFGDGRINPLALIEITYMYFYFYTEIVKKFSTSIDRLQIEVRFQKSFRERAQILTFTVWG